MQFGNPWIALVLKSVVKLTPQGRLHPRIGIDRHWLFLQIIKSADVIGTSDMVFVTVGKQQGIQAIHPGTKHLLPKIRPRINHKMSRWVANQDRTTKAAVSRIGGLTNRAGATDQGNALGGPGSQNSTCMPDMLRLLQANAAETPAAGHPKSPTTQYLTGDVFEGVDFGCR